MQYYDDLYSVYAWRQLVIQRSTAHLIRLMDNIRAAMEPHMRALGIESDHGAATAKAKGQLSGAHHFLVSRRVEHTG